MAVTTNDRTQRAEAGSRLDLTWLDPEQCSWTGVPVKLRSDEVLQRAGSQGNSSCEFGKTEFWHSLGG